MSTSEMLASYAQCPMGSPSSCRFGEPLPYAPRVERPGVGVARVHQCASCGHGVTRPPIENVSVLYEGRKSQDYQPADGRFAQRIKEIVFDRQARHLLRTIGRSPKSLVDFACGSGLFTSRLAAMLPPGCRVVALDFFEESPRAMPGVEYMSFRKLFELDQSADVLLCFHALEHDDDPEAFLGRLLPLLARGGALIIEVPNVFCAWAPIFGAQWDNWYLPFHRIHFSRTSLRGLLQRHGLKIERETDVCVPSMGRSLARAFGRKQTLPFFVLGIVLHPLQWAVEQLTGRPSALRVIARRE